MRKTVFELIREHKAAVQETPCIVVDTETAKKNICRMQEAVSACGCKLRPHIKTHKIPYFARLQLAAGAEGITCAKVSEAEVMAAGGVEDIFIAYPMVGEFRIHRALELQKRVKRLILAVDSLEGAAALSRSAGEAGLTCEVRLVTEVRPGTYIFGDWMLTKENCAAVEDIAVRLYAMVVSTPAPDYAVLDGGTKTFPMDIPLDTPPFLYPGYAIPIGGDGKPDENLQLRRMNEEHGILTAKNGRTGLRVGQVLELIPIHVCTAVNMQNSVFVFEDGVLRRMPVEARGMLV